jgi:uncharacterized membrane protein (DUF373 family)
MNKLTDFFQSKFYIEIIVATLLFIVAIATNSIIIIIIYLLYFMIMLEIVRAVIGFIREQRVQIRILIDAFIILSLREFIVNVVKINKESIDSFEALLSNSTNFHILIFSGVLIFLFILRWLAMITSPDKKNKS